MSNLKSINISQQLPSFRVHLPSVERRNQEGNQEESEGIQISSDALSEGPIEAHATSLPRDQSITLSKACDVSTNENDAAKKTKKSPKNKTLTAVVSFPAENLIMLIYFVFVSRDFEFCQIVSLPQNFELSRSFALMDFPIMLMYFCCGTQMSWYMAVVFRLCSAEWA